MKRNEMKSLIQKQIRNKTKQKRRLIDCAVDKESQSQATR